MCKEDEEYNKKDVAVLKDLERELDLANDEYHLKQLEDERLNRPSWDQTFMDVARVVARRSKDPRTKVGCVLVKNNCIVATGYNGEPRNFRYEFDWNTSEKYNYVVHAEMNCLLNAVYNGAGNSIKDADIYLTLAPCHDCIKMLVQAGIKRVFYLTEYKDFELTKKIADNADIELIKVDL